MSGVKIGSSLEQQYSIGPTAKEIAKKKNQ